MQLIEITDLNDPALAPYARLTEAELRAGSGIFIAESVKVIGHALDAGYRPVSLLMERKHAAGKAHDLIERCDVPIYTADRSTLAQLTGYELTRGVLCAMRRRELPSLDQICADARRLCVIEDITDSTNVGAIFRSAAALGVDAVLLSPRCCDPLCRRAIRVSMGTVFQVPWTRAQKGAEWPDDALEVLRGYGFKSAALALSENAIRIDDPRPAAEERLAIFIGTEGTGLTERTIAACDYVTRIPMSHGVDSLNAAAASAVAFWQLIRRQA